MAKRISDKQDITSAEPVSSLAAAPTTTVSEPPPADPSDQSILELKDLTRSLLDAVKLMQAQSTRNAIFQDAIKDVKSATRSMMAAPVATAAGYGAVPQPAPVKDDCDDCDDCGCGCTDAGCCCFEIVLDKVRAIQPQREPADSGDTTLPVPLINELEVRLFASIDQVGILIPSLSTTMGLRVPSLLSGGGPGLWMPLGSVIGRVCLKKGCSRTVTVDFQGCEVDEGIERPLGFKDEHGAASGSITLDCCTSKIYPPMPTDLSFDFGGSGGGTPGAISMAFYARRVCC